MMAAERFANLEELPYDPAAAADSLILLRLPSATHEALKAEAAILEVSLNALVLSKSIAEVWGCRLVEPWEAKRRWALRRGKMAEESTEMSRCQ